MNSPWIMPLKQRDRASQAMLILLSSLVIGCLAVADGLGITEAMLDMVAKEYGRRARSRIIKWQDLVDKHNQDTEREKLEAVNKFFNRNRFISDLQHWKKSDYWATPIEFLATKGGDCEDFSIAKYITLRALGIPEKKLRITYVKALRINQAHMVLTYYETPRSIPLIMDNIDTKIKPAHKRPDLKPVYSFNAEGLWLAKMRGEGQKTGSASDLNMWRDLEARLKRERGAK